MKDETILSNTTLNWSLDSLQPTTSLLTKIAEIEASTKRGEPFLQKIAKALKLTEHQVRARRENKLYAKYLERARAEFKNKNRKLLTATFTIPKITTTTTPPGGHLPSQGSTIPAVLFQIKPLLLLLYPTQGDYCSPLHPRQTRGRQQPSESVEELQSRTLTLQSDEKDSADRSPTRICRVKESPRSPKTLLQ